MNDFYHISNATSQGQLKGPYQLLNLGDKRPSITIGKPTRDGYGSRSMESSTYYTATTPADYDRQFMYRIIKYQPPYEVDQFLNYHFDHYVKTKSGSPEKFIKHIKYVIMPLVERNGRHQIFLELLSDWLATAMTQEPKAVEMTQKKEKPLNQTQSKINPISMSEVFISYSWDSPQHEQQVLEFTEHLRKKGFDAQLDKMLSQQETATNFVKMMHKAMHEHPKVIVVLSKGYKLKAETFTGGVGEEYQLLLNDINEHPKKYILVSFVGRSADIIPFGLQGRDITDLSAPSGEEKLFRKLMDKDVYTFSPVASEKPVFDSVPIGNFELSQQHPLIVIEAPETVKGDISSTGGLYKFVEFELFLRFKNHSGNTIEGFAYTLKIKQQLAPEYYGQPATDGYFVFNDNITQKIYPNQTIKSKGYKIKIAGHAINQVLGTSIGIELFTDSGMDAKEFAVEEIFKVSPVNQQYQAPSPLSKEFFAERWN